MNRSVLSSITWIKGLFLINLYSLFLNNFYYHLERLQNLYIMQIILLIYAKDEEEIKEKNKQEDEQEKNRG